jgi:hypothetical protein
MAKVEINRYKDGTTHVLVNGVELPDVTNICLDYGAPDDHPTLTVELLVEPDAIILEDASVHLHVKGIEDE